MWWVWGVCPTIRDTQVVMAFLRSAAKASSDDPCSKYSLCILLEPSLSQVNPSDVSSITGNYAGFKLPEDGVGIPGGDALGTVAKLGADVTGLEVG